MKKLLAVLLITSSPVSAGTAFFKSDHVTGMTKQCYYDYFGSEYVRTMRNIDLCPLTTQVNDAGTYRPTAPTPPPISLGGLAFFTGEENTGLTKQCYYEYLGDTYTKTMSSIALCPLSVRVR
jgi:hypothetical protein